MSGMNHRSRTPIGPIHGDERVPTDRSDSVGDRLHRQEPQRACDRLLVLLVTRLAVPESLAIVLTDPS